MKKTIRLDNGLIVTVVAAAIHRAKVCKKTIARYDPKSKQVYVEMPNGERIYH